MASAAPEDLKTEPVAPAPAPAGRASHAGFFRRLSVGANVTVQMILLAFILLAVNGYAFKHYHRFDFSRDRKYALSDRTKQLLKDLKKPVKLIVFMSAKSPLQADVANLAQEYRSTNPKQVTIDNVDTFRDAGRASEISSKYKLTADENVVILDSEGRSKIIRDEKMAELDTSGVQYGQPPTISAFTGEQAITAGLLEVIEGKKSNVYYVQGHGEGAVGEGKSLDILTRLLDSEHVSVQEVNLLNVQAVPTDAVVLMILGPKIDYNDREVKMLDDYWAKGGRVLLLLNPDSATPHLSDFLARLGIQTDDNRVLRTLDLAGGVVGIVRDVYTEIIGSTPIARQLAGINVPLSGATETFTLEPEKVASAGTRVEPLLQALKGYWGETEYKDLEATGVYLDKGKDKETDLVVAATVQKGAVADQRVQTNAARLVVVNNSHLVESNGINEQSANFFVGSLNWLLERDTLIGVAPKLIKSFTLNLPEDQVRTLFWTMVLAIPGACAFLGLIVWWRRRA